MALPNEGWPQVTRPLITVARYFSEMDQFPLVMRRSRGSETTLLRGGSTSHDEHNQQVARSPRGLWSDVHGISDCPARQYFRRGSGGRRSWPTPRQPDQSAGAEPAGPHREWREKRPANSRRNAAAGAWRTATGE